MIVNRIVEGVSRDPGTFSPFRRLIAKVVALWCAGVKFARPTVSLGITADVLRGAVLADPSDMRWRCFDQVILQVAVCKLKFSDAVCWSHFAVSRLAYEYCTRWMHTHQPSLMQLPVLPSISTGASTVRNADCGRGEEFSLCAGTARTRTVQNSSIHCKSSSMQQCAVQVVYSTII